MFSVALRPHSLAKPLLTCSTLRSAGAQTSFESIAAAVRSDTARPYHDLFFSMSAIRALLAIHQIVEGGNGSAKSAFLPTGRRSCAYGCCFVHNLYCCALRKFLKCDLSSLVTLLDTRRQTHTIPTVRS
jgi:hypothetical protein